MADKLGIDLCLHELRHTAISVLANRGVYPQLISDRHGHVDPSISKAYTHTLMDMQQVAVNVMSSFLAEARELAKKASSS
jgi:integrase